MFSSTIWVHSGNSRSLRILRQIRQKASFYANEFADWELGSIERLNNFWFEKFRAAPLATPKFATWWEATFRKLIVQPLNALLPKLKHVSIPASLRHPPPPARVEEPSSATPPRTVFANEASASKSKHLFYSLLYVYIS